MKSPQAFSDWMSAATTVGLLITSETGEIQHISKAGQWLFRLKAQEWKGKTLCDFCYGEKADSTQLFAQLIQDAETGIWKSLDHTFRRQERPFQAQVLYTKLHSAQSEEYLFLINDISPDREPDEFLARPDFVESVLNASFDLIYLFDLGEQRNIWSNKEIKDMLGYSRQEIQEMGSSLLPMLIHPEDMDSVMAHQKRLRNLGQEVLTFEFRMKARNGAYHWLRTRETRYQTDDQGHTRVILGIAEDITESKETEERERKRNSELNSFIESAPGYIMAFDREYRYLHFNKRHRDWVYNVFGTEVAIGKRLDDVVLSAESLASIKANYQRAFAGESYTLLQPYPSGNETYYYETTFTPIRNDGDEVIGISIFSTDVTDHIQAKEAMRQAKELAEKTSAEKLFFLSSLSHELRTPLNAVVGMANLLTDSSLKGQDRENIEVLKNAADNLLELINNILDYGKLDAGKVELEQVDFHLSKLLGGLLETHQHKAHQKGISLQLDLPRGLADDYNGDPIRLLQVLNNLVSNAIKFTASGTVKIAVHSFSYKSKDPCPLLRFSVKDTGIGIAPEKVSTIFETWSQASQDTTRLYGGTGLGLSISQALVRMLGGELKVASKLNQGSEFYFEIPFRLATTASNYTFLRDETKLPTPSPNEPLPGLKVLVAEDNEVNQLVIKRFLEKWQVEFQVVKDGQEALDWVHQQSFDLILMDLNMPVMNGLQATRQMREEGYKLPIVALTASAPDSLQNELAEYQLNGYLTKPFQPADLHALLSRYRPKN